MVEDSNQAGFASDSLKFGIFDWIDSNGQEIADLYEERLNYLEYADQAGFYCYHLAEHQGTPLGMAPSPGLFLSAAAQRTSQIHLGPLVYILPIYNPLRLLQEICMLDHLSRGRLELGVGRGVSPHELGFYNITPEQSREMFQEAFEVVTSGLRTGEVSYEGKYYNYNQVKVHLTPYQKPYPPLWYPTDRPDSVRWLAQEGINTITHYAAMELMRENFDLYKSAWQEGEAQSSRLNSHVPNPFYGIVRHVYVADTDKLALQEAKSGFRDFIGNFNFLRRITGDTSGRAEYLEDFEGRLAEGLHVVGSPDTVREEIRKQVEITGTNYFVGSFFFGTLTPAQTMKSLKLFTEEVIPAFR
ncbi:MAG: LLM class flavin-dependent oxidoreductase [Dehalococcoidia bacterium]